MNALSTVVVFQFWRLVLHRLRCLYVYLPGSTTNSLFYILDFFSCAFHNRILVFCTTGKVLWFLKRFSFLADPLLGLTHFLLRSGSIRLFIWTTSSPRSHISSISCLFLLNYITISTKNVLICIVLAI